MSDNTLHINEELHERLKKLKTKKGTSLQWQAEKAIEEYLKREEKK